MTGRTLARERAIEIWNQVVESRPDALRVETEDLIYDARSTSESEAHNHLEPWLTVLDEQLHALYQANRLAHECFSPLEEEKHQTRATIYLFARTLSLSVAVRHLITAGLEDAARPVIRSLLETRDLALVALGDPNFAQLYDDENTSSENFWKDQVGHGKLNFRLRQVLAQIDSGSELIDDFFRRRHSAKGNLSGAVHSSSDSAFRSWMIPSLIHEDHLVMGWFGHLSVHSPGSLRFLIEEVYEFLAIVSKLLSLDTPPLLFRDVQEGEILSSFVAALLTAHRLKVAYQGQLDSLPDWFE